MAVTLSEETIKRLQSALQQLRGPAKPDTPPRPEDLIEADPEAPPRPEDLIEPDSPVPPIDTRTPLVEPVKARVDAIPGPAESPPPPWQMDAIEARIRAAAQLTDLTPTRARSALQMSYKSGLPPQIAADDLVGLQSRYAADDIIEKLSQMPRMARFMAESSVNTQAVKDEIDNLGVLEWALGAKTGPGRIVTKADEPYVMPPLMAPPRGAPGDLEEFGESPEPERVYDLTMPGWLLSAGRASYAAISSMRTWLEMRSPGGKSVDMARIKYDRELLSGRLPGEGKSLASRVLYAASDSTPLFLATMIHPAAVFALMYTEGGGRIYEDLRLQGWKHEDASKVADVAGFAGAAIASGMGQRLFGTLMPKTAVSELVAGVDSAVLRAVSDNPTLWRFLKDTGINQLHATLMNSAAAATEAATIEGFAAARDGRRPDPWVVAHATVQAARGSLDFLPLSVYAGARQASERRALWEAGGPFRDLNKWEASYDAQRERQIFDIYEEQGHALNSLKDAADISAAADAVERSQLFKENPELGKRIIKNLMLPRRMQRVFFDPEKLMKLPEAELDSLNPGDIPTAAQTGTKVPVSMEDFLTSPEGRKLAKDAVAEPDGVPAKDAGDTVSKLSELIAEKERIWQTEPPSPERLKKIDAIMEQMRAVAARAAAKRGAPESEGGSGRPAATPEEMGAPPPGADPNWRFYEPPGASSPPPRATVNMAEPPRTAKAYKLWAEDAVSGRTIGELDALARTHAQVGRKARSDLAKKQEQAAAVQGRATEAALQGIDAAQAGQVGRAEERGSTATLRAAEAEGHAMEAEDLKQKAMSNEAMAEASRKAQKKAGEIRDYVDERSTADVRREIYKAHYDYGEAHDAILEALGGKEHGVAAPDVSDAYERMRMDGYTPDNFDAPFLNKLISNPRPLDDMTVTEAGKVRAALQELEMVARAKNTIGDAVRRDALEAVRDGIANHLSRLPDRPPGQRGLPDDPASLSVGQRVMARLAHLGSEAHQAQTIFFKMGPEGDRLYFDGFIPARNREERYHQEVLPALQEIDKNTPPEVRDSAGDVVEPLPGMPGQRVRSNVWRLALHLGTQDGMQKISRSLGLTPTELAAYVQRNIGRDPEHARLVMENMIEPTWRIFDRLWDKYDLYFRDQGIAPPKTLERTTVTINGKAYKGGYGGRLRWLDDLTTRREVDEGSVAALFGRDYYDPDTPQQFLNERTGKTGMPNLNWEGVAGSVRAEIHHLAFDNFIENTHKLLSDRLVRSLLNEKIGEQYVNQLYDPKDETSWLHTVARGKLESVNAAPAMTRLIENLQGRAAMSAFALNTRVIVGQFSHIPAMMAGLRIGPIDMANGIMNAMDPQRRNLAHLKSQVLAYRDEDFERKNTELTAEITGVRPGEGFETAIPGVAAGQRVSNKMNWALWREMDGFLSHAIWEAAYAKGRSTGITGVGLNDEEAIRYADKAVSRAMPAQTIYDQSAMVRNRAALGMLFLVRNFPNTLYNVGALNAWNARLAGGGPVRRYGAGAGAALSYTAMVMSAEIFGKWMMGHGPGDEDTDTWLARRSVGALFYPTMTGELVEGGILAMQGRKREAAYNLERAAPALGVTGKLLLDLGDAVNKDDEAQVRAVLDAAGIAVKVPLSRYFDVGAGALSGEGPVESVGKAMGYTK